MLAGAETVEIDEGGRLMLLAEVGFAEATWVLLVKSVIIFALVFAIVPVLTVVERKILGRFQARYGPNRVGPIGLRAAACRRAEARRQGAVQAGQRDRLPVGDAPAIVVFTRRRDAGDPALGQHPGGRLGEVGLYGIDVSIGVLYFFAFGSISFYGLLLGGWASGSKYSFLGAMRSAAQLISYEISMGLALLGAVMMAGLALAHRRSSKRRATSGTSSPSSSASSASWSPASPRRSRAPFDLPEADAELVAGYQTEYGGMRCGSFMMAEYIEMFVISGIAVTFFLGGWMGPGPGFLDPIWMLAEDPRADVRLLLGAGDAPARPLRPADEPRLEDPAAAATLNVLVTAVLVTVI